MNVITPFDPWKSKLCTCPPKFSFNPYTGCAHGCVYCYATYIPDFHRLRLKRNLFRRLEKDIQNLPKNALISMSNSSDPYPPVEREMRITRRCLEIMKDYDVRLLIVTKGDVFVRDIDLLSEMKVAVSVTITGCDEAEPFAPETERRIEAFKKLKDSGIPAILRFDPVMPLLNEDKLWIIEKCEPDHVVTSTLKLRSDSFRRMVRVYGMGEYRRLYLVDGERIRGYYYLKSELRRKMLWKVKNFCRDLGISCSFCREGLSFDAKSCDGSHLIE